LDQLAAVLTPVFERYARDGQGASFGDWTSGVGAEAVTAWLPEPVVRRRGARAEVGAPA
jgi:hypothetical protein